MSNVLVLGHDERSFLSVVRSLGRAKLSVHVAWHAPEGAAARSRYIAAAHRLPPFREDSDDWKAALIDLLRRVPFELVIPVHDSGVAALQRHRDELSRYARLFTLNDRAYEVFASKLRTLELARSLGIAVPRERAATSHADADGVIEEFGLPLVLKPHTSYNSADPDARHAVRKVYAAEQFGPALTAMLRSGPVSIQQNFIGRGVGVELLLRDGEPLLTFQHERVHEPLHGGGSSYRKSVPVSPALLDAALKLMRAVNYTGVAMVEFKVDPQRGAWVLLEVNARFWGSLPLALAAGADFPLGLYQLLVTGRVDVPRRPRVGTHCRNLLSDAAWLRDNLRADHRDATLATRPLRLVLRDAAVNTLLGREHFDTLVVDDPWPGLHELRELLARGAAAARTRLARRAARVPLVRRRMRRSATAALRAARRVLFVCKGNICRSPFAQRFARGMDPGRVFASAGYYPKEGRPAPDTAVAAAREWSLDLSDHRSRRVTDSMLRDADLVLVFDGHNMAELRRRYPGARGKLRFIGALGIEGDLEVPDPYGGDEAAFRGCYARLARLLRDALGGASVGGASRT